jgi:hypothetical protein
MRGKWKALEDYFIAGNINECWLWQGGTNPKGYGTFTQSLSYKTQSAHKAVYEKYKGEIPEGKEIHHTCTNRLCVNPNHLEAITHLENVRKSSRSRFTKEQADDIRRRVANGEARYTIQHELNVSKSALNKLIRFATWR